MNKDVLKEMAKRSRRMAGMADKFTKRRLLDLAERYEAPIEVNQRPAVPLTTANIAAKTVPSRRGGER
jgi:hypothetical protein